MTRKRRDSVRRRRRRQRAVTRAPRLLLPGIDGAVPADPSPAPRRHLPHPAGPPAPMRTYNKKTWTWTVIKGETLREF